MPCVSALSACYDGYGQFTSSFSLSSQAPPSQCGRPAPGRCRYAITLSERMAIDYPRREYNNVEKEKKDIFCLVIAYNDVKPESARSFDRRRPKGVKSWVTVAQYNGCSSWGDMLQKLSLKPYSRRRSTFKNAEIKVTVYHDLFDCVK